MITILPKRRSRPALLLLAFLVSVASLASYQHARASAIEELEERLAKLYQDKSDAIVRVKVATQAIDKDGQESAELTVFSGFFVSDDGKVVTNAIPREDSTRIWIERAGVSLLAKPIGANELANISLLQIVTPIEDIVFVDLREPSTPPGIGSFAFAISSPMEFAPSPSLGLVTGFESQFADLSFPFTYTRISIPIGPAEGGSPVFNTQGQLIGISVAALPEFNSGYLVPTAALRHIVTDLGNQEGAGDQALPIVLEEIVDRANNQRYIAIKTIFPGSQAELAGVKMGDILLTVNQMPIENINQARDLIFFSERGAFLSLTIERNGQQLEFALLLKPKESHARATE